MNYWLFISLVAAAVAVYGMIDVLRARTSNNKKMLWFAIIVLLPLVGPLSYFFRKRSIVEVGGKEAKG
ncbi:PLD nuclease N-terminal domain-containing protein [Ekhidna sp.]|uniref:PLD nuclease N-terminal domain-containing protein n=1 Tax=Ekhidna sp. TaxID=2608089 RepID=UPI0032EF01F8